MKLSTKGRYGVSAMYDLALHHGQGPISLKSVAMRQEFPNITWSSSWELAQGGLC